MLTDDRTTRAKIRDAAISEIAAQPPNSVTVRDIAAAAGVSPASVIHHFGTMDGLRRACNEHVSAAIRAYKSDVVAERRGLDLLAALKGISDLPIAGYLAKAALGESTDVDELIDGLVDDAVAYLDEGVVAGTIRPSAHARERAAILVLWSLGGLVLHDHMERLIGIDLTDPDEVASPKAAVYTVPVFDVMSRGLLTESFAAELDVALAAAYGAPSTDTTPAHPEEQP